MNNAGVFHREGLLETTVEHWEETLVVNLRAPFLLAQVVARGMIERRRGKIVNISSLAARVGCEGHAAYSSSKGGLDMLTRVMAAEWGPFNIQTNSVAPTVVLTDIHEAHTRYFLRRLRELGYEATLGPLDAPPPVAA